MMSMLLPLADDFIAVRPDNDRAMSAENLKNLLIEIGAKAESCDSIENAVKLLVDKAGKDGICACLGSLYFSGEIRQAYQKLRQENHE